MIVYWSGSGVTENTARKHSGVRLDEYDGASEYTLMIPSYGSPRTGGHIPPPIMQFLGQHGHRMTGVIGVGNTVFGDEFCQAAKDVAFAFDVPVLSMIDLVPTKEQTYLLRKLEENDEEVPGA